MEAVVVWVVVVAVGVVCVVVAGGAVVVVAVDVVCPEGQRWLASVRTLETACVSCAWSDEPTELGRLWTSWERTAISFCAALQLP